MRDEGSVKIQLGKASRNISPTAKTLVYVPKMFTKEEFKALVGKVPEDFDKTSKDFWEYVKGRLMAVSAGIRWVYSSSFPKGVEEPHPRGEDSIVEYLVKNGAQLKVVKDPLLAAEARGWFEMKKRAPSQVVSELYEESLREMSKRILDVVDQTLKEGEMGVLFINSSLEIPFPKEMRVIRMFPFNPQDYLKRHQVKLSNKGRSQDR